MESHIKEVFAQMLGGRRKDLPANLIETYERAKYMLDRIGGGDFSPQSLVCIAMASGADLPRLPKRTDAVAKMQALDDEDEDRQPRGQSLDEDEDEDDFDDEEE